MGLNEWGLNGQMGWSYGFPDKAGRKESRLDKSVCGEGIGIGYFRNLIFFFFSFFFDNSHTFCFLILHVLISYAPWSLVILCVCVCFLRDDCVGI
ncbi:hypothetical protein F4778DRAFT_236064 [Xylariomycetidae sp. FL2044]|nr:hypothetical protein F4778DRAFT_236064 [Xylariomycetidae sp. FL2044]